MNKQIEKEKEKILSNAKKDARIINEKNIQYLPLPVQNWLESSGVIGKKINPIIHLTQTALMKTKPEQKGWYKAKAEQWITTEPPAYIWTVKLNIMQILRIKGRDKFVDGKGNMLMKMNSLFILGNDSGEKIDEGSIQRFLAEMVWYPSFAVSDYIAWETIDNNSAKASMTYRGTKGTGVFHFNDQGEIEKITALRYMGNKEDKRYEWLVKIKKHSVINGINIPTRLEIVWKLDTGNWKWLELKITEYIYE